VQTKRRGRLAVGAVTAIVAVTSMTIAAPAKMPPREPTRSDVEKEKVTSAGAEKRPPGVHIAKRGRSRCTSYWAERWGKNLLGKKMYNYRLEINWCYRRGRITSASYNTIPTTGGLFWKWFSKDEKIRRSGGTRRSYYQIYAQGHFAACGPASIGCVQDKYPWVQIRVTGAGGATYRNGG